MNIEKEQPALDRLSGMIALEEYINGLLGNGDVTIRRLRSGMTTVYVVNDSDGETLLNAVESAWLRQVG